MPTVIAGARSHEFGTQKAHFIGILAVLVLAAQCAAAPGTPVLSGLSSTNPGGFVFDGSSWWVTDLNLGFCRIDPAVPPAGSIMTNCVKPSATAVLGQPAYDGLNKFVYLPDQGCGSRGIWRYALNGGIFNSPLNVAAALGGQRPGAITIGGDGNLYVSMTANATVVRVTTATQATATIMTTQSGKPAHGLATVGSELWVVDRDGVLLVPNATGCGNKCKGTLNTLIGVSSPLSIVKDNVYVYIGSADGVFRFNPNTVQTDLYSNSYPAGLYSDVTAVGVNNVGDLYLADDPTAGQDAGGANVYTVPAGSAPGGQGPAPNVPPTVRLTTIPAAISNPAALYSTGPLAAPKGAI